MSRITALAAFCGLLAGFFTAAGLGHLGAVYSLFFRWYDLWIGAYWDRKARALYVCPLPTIGLKVEFDDPRWEHELIAVKGFQGAVDDIARQIRTGVVRR